MPVYRIASRHLLSRKSHTVVNLISIVSIVAMAVPVMAMVVILSLHNGLSGFIEGMYSNFDSQIRLTPTTGQNFGDYESLSERLRDQVPQITAVSATLEQNVLLTYGERQTIATIRGVDSLYTSVVPIAERVTQGEFNLADTENPEAILGQGIAYTLGVNTILIDPLTIYSIRTGSRSPSFIPLGIYRSADIRPTAIYTLDQQTDSRYLFAPLGFVQSLLESPGRVSSLEIALSPDADPTQIKEQIARAAGPQFTVQTRLEQRGTIYRMITQEKWIIYLLLLFVVLIAALSLVGSVVMLITDKAASRGILEAMGASAGLLQRVFTIQGVMITTAAVTIGTAAGIGLALIQQYSGVIKMAGGAFLTESYPVQILPTDIAIIALGVTAVGCAISYLTTISLVRKTQR